MPSPTDEVTEEQILDSAPSPIPDEHVNQAEPGTSLPAPYSKFSKSQRYLIITVATLSASFSGFASNIYFPAIPTIASSLHTTVENVNLTVTSYMIFQAITPAFWGAIADVFGRRATLMCTFLVFLSATIGIAVLQHYYQLVILRSLQSSGSASTIAIGAGMIGDITTREQRGGVMGIFQTGLLLPLAIGPILGGVFAQTLGWRAIFWFLVIYGGVFLIFLSIFLPETLRAMVGDGSKSPPSWAKAPLDPITAPPRSLEGGKSEPTKHLKVDFSAPVRILFYPEVSVTLLFLGLHYATWQMTVTAQANLFASTYGINEIDIGLTFIANGAGCMIGTLSTGKLLDREYQRFKGQYKGPEEDFDIESARLKTLWIWSPLQWASVLMFGWTLNFHVHLAAPIVASFFLAWSAMSAQSVITTYLVDTFPQNTASAAAALNLVRCLLGAAATASVQPTIDRIGVGWTFTLWVFLMVLSLGLIAIQMQFGRKWRRSRETKNVQVRAS